VAKFPVDAPKSKVIKALGLLGFRLVREREQSPWRATIRTGHRHH